MKRALVLAGGGARGAFQVGMLQELVVHGGLDFQVIRGVSVGALNAAFLAQAPGGDESLEGLRQAVRDLKRIWTRKIEGNHSVYAKRGGFPGLVAGMDSLYSLKPLRRLIEDHLSPGALRNSGRDFAVSTVSLPSGRYHEWVPEDAYFIEKLVASASIPVVFPYVDLKRAREVLVDGGVRNITPLSSAFAARPDEIYVLLTSRVVREGNSLPDSTVCPQSYEEWADTWLGTRVSGLDVLTRTIEILTDEIYLDDIRGALTWNELTGAINDALDARPEEGMPDGLSVALDRLEDGLEQVNKRHVPIYVIAPRELYGPANDSTAFSPEFIAHAIEHGRAVASDPDLWLWPPGA